MNSRLRFTFAPVAAAFALTLCGCTIAGDYHVADGAHMQRGYRSIAGAVQIGSDAIIRNATTVAGAIEVGDRATTRSLNSVAGEIQIGERTNIDGDVSTVAGAIRINARTHVTGEVGSIAGAIDLNGCRVDGRVSVTKGSLRTRGPTLLPGGIVVRGAHSMGNDNPPRIDIGPGADVASIHVEPGTEIDLHISREAHVGTVSGATASYY